MTTTGRTYPYTMGTVELAPDAFVLRRSPARFLRSQLARFRRPSRFDRIVAGATLLSGLFLPVITVRSFHLVFVSSEPYQSAPMDVIFPLFTGVLGLLVMWEGVRDRRTPLDQLTAGVETRGKRTIRLPVSPHSTWRRLGLPAADPEVTLVRRRDRERLISRLAAAGVPVERRDTDTEAAYRFFKQGGGYFCPDCGGRVSVRDEGCPECGRLLRAAGPGDVPE